MAPCCQGVYSQVQSVVGVEDCKIVSETALPREMEFEEVNEQGMVGATERSRSG